jgi:hypothetical protein
MVQHHQADGHSPERLDVSAKSCPPCPCWWRLRRCGLGQKCCGHGENDSASGTAARPPSVPPGERGFRRITAGHLPDRVLAWQTSEDSRRAGAARIQIRGGIDGTC